MQCATHIHVSPAMLFSAELPACVQLFALEEPLMDIVHKSRKFTHHFFNRSLELSNEVHRQRELFSEEKRKVRPNFVSLFTCSVRARKVGKLGEQLVEANLRTQVTIPDRSASN